MVQMLSCPWNFQAQGPFLASVWTSWQAQGPVPTDEYPARAGFSKAATLRLFKKHLPRQTKPQVGDKVSPMQLLLTGTAMLGPQKPIFRVGGGELLCYMERISPLSENKDPPLGTHWQSCCPRRPGRSLWHH